MESKIFKTIETFDQLNEINNSNLEGQQESNQILATVDQQGKIELFDHMATRAQLHEEHCKAMRETDWIKDGTPYDCFGSSVASILNHNIERIAFIDDWYDEDAVKEADMVGGVVDTEKDGEDEIIVVKAEEKGKGLLPSQKLTEKIINYAKTKGLSEQLVKSYAEEAISGLLMDDERPIDESIEGARKLQKCFGIDETEFNLNIYYALRNIFHAPDRNDETALVIAEKLGLPKEIIEHACRAAIFDVLNSFTKMDKDDLEKGYDDYGNSSFFSNFNHYQNRLNCLLFTLDSSFESRCYEDDSENYNETENQENNSEFGPKAKELINSELFQKRARKVIFKLVEVDNDPNCRNARRFKADFKITDDIIEEIDENGEILANKERIELEVALLKDLLENYQFY